jgi:hypothetical protein
MVSRVAKAAGVPRHISPQSLRPAAISNALDAEVPLRDAQILANMPIREPPSTTTVPAATSTATASSSSPPVSPAYSQIDHGVAASTPPGTGYRTTPRPVRAPELSAV